MRRAALFVLFSPPLLLAVGASPEASWRLRIETPEEAYTVDASGKDRKPSSPWPVRPAGPGRSLSRAMSHDGKRLLYVSTKDGDAEILVSDADGKSTRQLTDNQCIDNFPSWSHDGQRILFASDRTGTWQAYSMRADGSDVRRLTEEKGSVRHPRWAPGGNIAYVHTLRSEGKLRIDEVVILGKDGARRAIGPEAHVCDIAFSPDGKRLACGTPGFLTIYEAASGKPERTITAKEIHPECGAAHGASSLSWRPDGRAIAFRLSFLGGRWEGMRLPGDEELFIVPLEEGKAGPIRIGESAEASWIRE